MWENLMLFQMQFKPFLSAIIIKNISKINGIYFLNHCTW